MICRVCNKEFESTRATAKYCSPKCRVKASRVTLSDDNVTLSPQKAVTLRKNVTLSVTLTPTDEELIMLSEKGGKRHGYKFDDRSHEKNCVQCGKKFKTRLGLNRFCGAVCRTTAIMQLTNVKIKDAWH